MSPSPATQRTYDGQGNILTTTDEVGRVTSFNYDHENRLVKTTLNDGSFTEVEYDALGRRTASIDAKNNRTEYEYDEVGNNTLVRDALMNETTYEYDEVNRRTAMVDALNQRTDYLYDDYDRLTQTTFHDGTYKETGYDDAGRKISETDQESKMTEFVYDSVGNLKKVIDAMLFETEYTYDENNNRISQEDANDHVTTLAYDKLNRLISRTYPNSDEERFGYDANGNRLYRVAGTSSTGDSTAFEYDSRNREIYRWYSNSGHTVETKYTADSRRDTVIDYRGMATYEWGDCCGQLVKVTNPDNTFIEYEYDDNKNKTAMVTPWGTTQYTYDVLNRMKTVISPDNDVTEYFYNAVGNRDSISHANGTSVGYDYDDLNRLTYVTNYGVASSMLSSYEYELNNAGIRTAVNEYDGSRVDYGYDDLYKLTSETRTGTNAYSIFYTYDNVGNRLTKDHDGVLISYAYNIRDQLESESNTSETITYTYDNSGRMGTKTDNAGVSTYSWIDNDRMSSVVTPSGTVSYEYNSEGIKVKTDDGLNPKWYLIDTQQPYAQVIAEYDGSSSLTAEYVYGLERISQDRSGSKSFYLADGQGSIRELTNTQGQVTDNYDYFAFGELLNKTGTTENEFRYVGEQIDPNTNFYYLRVRWMNPQTGRFVSVDPFGGATVAPLSFHRYLYANQSPVSFYDPSGKYTLVYLSTIYTIVDILAAIPMPSFLKKREPNQFILYIENYVDWVEGSEKLWKFPGVKYEAMVNETKNKQQKYKYKFKIAKNQGDLLQMLRKKVYNAVVTHSSQRYDIIWSRFTGEIGERNYGIVDNGTAIRSSSVRSAASTSKHTRIFGCQAAELFGNDLDSKISGYAPQSIDEHEYGTNFFMLLREAQLFIWRRRPFF